MGNAASRLTPPVLSISLVSKEVVELPPVVSPLCRVCGAVIPWNSKGRPRVFCEEPCLTLGVIEASSADDRFLDYLMRFAGMQHEMLLRFLPAA